MQTHAPQPTAQQARALLEAMRAIVQTVKETGDIGAPGGTLYAGLMTAGCTLTKFEAIMRGLVRNGFLRQQGNLYFHVKDVGNAAA